MPRQEDEQRDDGNGGFEDYSSFADLGEEDKREKEERIKKEKRARELAQKAEATRPGFFAEWDPFTRDLADVFVEGTRLTGELIDKSWTKEEEGASKRRWVGNSREITKKLKKLEGLVSSSGLSTEEQTELYDLSRNRQPVELPGASFVPETRSAPADLEGVFPPMRKPGAKDSLPIAGAVVAKPDETDELFPEDPLSPEKTSSAVPIEADLSKEEIERSARDLAEKAFGRGTKEFLAWEKLTRGMGDREAASKAILERTSRTMDEAASMSDEEKREEERLEALKTKIDEGLNRDLEELALMVDGPELPISREDTHSLRIYSWMRSDEKIAEAIEALISPPQEVDALLDSIRPLAPDSGRTQEHHPVDPVVPDIITPSGGGLRTFKELTGEVVRAAALRDNSERQIRDLKKALATETDETRKRRIRSEIARGEASLKRLESNLAVVKKGEEAFFKKAAAAGLFVDLDEDLRAMREGVDRNQLFYGELLTQRGREIKEIEGVPPELKGARGAYFKKEVDRIKENISIENIASQGKDSQLAWLRDNLADLGVAYISEDDLKSNMKWTQLRALISSPGIHRDVIEEFRARVDVSAYAGHLKSQTSLKEAIRGNDKVPTSKVAKLFEVPEISRAINLLEKVSDLTAEDLVRRDAEDAADDKVTDIEASGLRGLLGIPLSEKQKKAIGREILREMADEVGKPLLPRENILFAGSKEEKDTVYNKIARDLALSFGEDPNDAEVLEKYRKYVDEASNAWWLLSRPEDKGKTLPAGALTFKGRLMHFEERAKRKNHGTPEIRARLQAPWMRVKKADNSLRGVRPRGLGVDGFEVFSFAKFKKPALEEMGFSQDVELNGQDKIEFGKDGRGEDVPYATYRRVDGLNETVLRYVLKKNREDEWENATCIEVSKPTAKVMAEALKRTPDKALQDYFSLLMAVDGSREKLEDVGGILNSPLGTGDDATEEDLYKRMTRLKTEVFTNLDSMEEGRNPGEYHREDAWADALRGAINYGLTREARKSHQETWGIWRAKRADIMIKAALRAGLIKKEHVGQIEINTLGALPNRVIRKVFGKDASENPALKPIMRTFAVIDRSLGGKILDVPFGIWRTKGVKPFLFLSALFGFIGEFWNGLSEGLPSAGGGGGGSKKRR